MVYAFVASVSAPSAAGGSVTTGAIDTTGASLLIATVNAFNGINPIGNVTDSKGNTWVNLTTHVCNGGNVSGFIAYVLNPTVGTGHTFTFGAALTFPAICVAAFSGADLVAPFDAQTGADNVASQTGQPGPFIGSQDDTLYISCAQYLDATSVATVDQSFILQENVASDATATHVGSSLAYLIQAGAASAVNPTFTAANAGGIRQWLAIASFKPAASGGVTVKQLAALGVG